MDTRNLICTSIDDKFLWPWMVMVYSAAINSKKQNFRIILANINGMLSEGSISIAERFMKSLKLELEVLDIKSSLNPAFAHHYNLTIYSRLILMDMLEEDFFWFDADLILMPDWDQIFVKSCEQSTGDEVIFGVLDSKITRQKKEKELNQAYIRIEGAYVNSGVMKICVKNWEKLHKKNDWKEMARTSEDYGFTSNDQDVVNFICAGRVGYLPAGFNYIVGDEISVNEKILIKHYAGAPKPWKLDKKGREFIMAVQGTQYFAPKNWITQSSDAFLHYPMYWQVEKELLTYLHCLGEDFRQKALESRAGNLTKLNVPSLVKNYFMQFLGQKFFS
jgi:lipopolysaccharide biosynthesis glycosyltransferase